MNRTSMHLWNAANMLPMENRAHTLLKSYYLTKIRRENGSDLKQFSDEEVCRQCSTPWTDVQFSMSMNPIKKSKQQSKKILARIEDKTNPKKQRIAKKSAKKVNNAVKVKCNVCGYKKSVILWKQTSPALPPDEDVKPHGILNKSQRNADASQISKKRKRNRDKTAGLTLPAKMTTNAPQNNLQSGVSTTQQQPSQSTQKSANSNSKPQKKKTKLKLTGLKNGPTFAQKRNSLMHLANALKMKNKPNPQKDNKLEKLLR